MKKPATGSSHPKGIKEQEKQQQQQQQVLCNFQRTRSFLNELLCAAHEREKMKKMLIFHN
jgi:hypothetical protein